MARILQDQLAKAKEREREDRQQLRVERERERSAAAEDQARALRQVIDTDLAALRAELAGVRAIGGPVQTPSAAQ